MNRTDRILRRLYREHPITVCPAGNKKEELLQYANMYWKEKEELPMKRNSNKLLVTTAVILGMAVMLMSAAIAGYYYFTPDGKIVRESGVPTEMPEEADGIRNDTSLSGDGWRIRSVTWISMQGRTTLAVWASENSIPFTGLRAVTEDGEVYPLTEMTFHLGASLIGYTTTDIPKPASLTLECDTPYFSEHINFQPQDVIPAESSSGGLTLFGTTSGNTVYVGIRDDNFLQTELSATAELAFAHTEMETVTDTAGNVLKNQGGSSNTRSEDPVLTTRQVYETTPGEQIASLHTGYISVIYDFMNAVTEGTAPHVYVPVPAEGETLTGGWVLLDCDGFRYEIDSVRRDGDTLHFTSADGLQYSGVYAVSEDMRKFIYLCVPGMYTENTVHSAGGSQYDWNIVFQNSKISEYTNESGEIPVYLWQLGMSYEGDWTLDFPVE